MNDIRRQPIGSWAAIEAYREEMEGDLNEDLDSLYSDHAIEVSIEPGNQQVQP